MASEERSKLIKKIRFEMSHTANDRTYEVPNLGYIDASRIKDSLKEDFHVVGPGTDEENSKWFRPRYILAFMHHSAEVEYA